MQDKTTAIKITEIQAGSNSKLGSPKYISFLLLIDNFGHFERLTTAVLMKVPIIVDGKKRSHKLSTQKLRPAATASPDLLNSLAFYC